ncbi:hypothetical protein K493DRAFT_281456 [Basidiobolus meristosporus CBS 931.73]|uniref:Uncharacterized protein n=1 Tax=Basidiobolus meristosporus CBS 931.73 TaxID=1314790 RepID=A0A1Y1YGZ2_9FUNG|nr:hypothetical protein K493DRAFT_281456 [Basidiobolus meristosporus CBS 931.73]|eukprot:ORX97218.1 hypothetical protein K493DRAFT_281456 [Basidiobolus meristosporus CBS 931.73]
MDQLKDATEWEQKLLGKKLVDSNAVHEDTLDRNKVVTKSELPEFHRIITPSSMFTMDFMPDRLSVEVNNDNVIQSVKYA